MYSAGEYNSRPTARIRNVVCTPSFYFSGLRPQALGVNHAFGVDHVFGAVPKVQLGDGGRGRRCQIECRGVRGLTCWNKWNISVISTTLW
jgi:hypothetical protein